MPSGVVCLQAIEADVCSLFARVGGTKGFGHVKSSVAKCVKSGTPMGKIYTVYAVLRKPRLLQREYKSLGWSVKATQALALCSDAPVDRKRGIVGKFLLFAGVNAKKIVTRIGVVFHVLYAIRGVSGVQKVFVAWRERTVLMHTVLQKRLRDLLPPILNLLLQNDLIIIVCAGRIGINAVADVQILLCTAIVAKVGTNG